MNDDLFDNGIDGTEFEYANSHYEIDEFLAEEDYCQFDYFWERLKHDMYNYNHFGHEDGPVAYAAELYAEELLEKELAEEAEERAWEDHLNPIPAFERQKMLELEVFGSYPDSHDRYEYYGLQAEEMADEFGPEPQNEDECKY